MTYSTLGRAGRHGSPLPDVRLPRLRQIRERRALSQEELAKLAGVSRQTIVALEHDPGRNAWPSTQRKLARALHVKPEELAAN